jgi:ribosomal protein S7
MSEQNPDEEKLFMVDVTPKRKFAMATTWVFAKTKKGLKRNIAKKLGNHFKYKINAKEIKFWKIGKLEIPKPILKVERRE